MNRLQKKIAQRQETERQERREAILEAARTVFFEKGYFGATIRDIAYEAALSPALIYHYFNNKDDIYGAICEEAFQLLIQVVEKAENQQGTLMDRLVVLARAYIGFYQEHTEYFEIISFKELGFKKVGISKSIMETLDQLSRRALEPLHTLVTEGLSSQEIYPASEPWELTMALWASIEGIIFIHKRGYFETFQLDMEKVVNRQLLILRDGILRNKT
jgi:AcrR family transcriptional regulator